MNIANRLNNLRNKFEEKNIDAFLVSQPENLYYLSGCEGLEGYILVTGKESVTITDFRYVEQAERQSPGSKIFKITGKIAEWMPKLLEGTGLKNIGFESSHLTVAAFDQIRPIIKGLSIEMTPVSGLIEDIRMIKEPEEIERIIKAAKITDRALDYAQELIKPGISEKEVAWNIEKFMRDNGSQTLLFEMIVASGPNSALPHARASGKTLQTGDAVVIDLGAKYEFYGADLTRTFYVGEPDDRYKKVYNTVLEAQLAGIEAIKAGMTGADIDGAAREVIAKAGYGENFGHGLGHGIGLVVHDKPHISIMSTDIIENGMVFTVEPGIYITGWGGVRIEDNVVIENGRARVISSAKK